MKYKVKVNKNVILLALFIIILLIPIPSSLRIFGIVLTPQRIIVPFCTLLLFFNKKMILSKKSNLLTGRYLILLYFLICLGLYFICTSPFAGIKNGIKELLELSIGLMSVFTLTILIKDKKMLKISLIAIKYVLFLSVIIGLYEIFSGNHLVMSIYNDSRVMANYKQLHNSLPNMNHATGFFYGENDFATFLGILFPCAFVLNKKRIEKYISIFTIGGIIFILLKNDANIVIISILIGMIIYGFSISTKKYGNKRAIINMLIFISITVALLCILNGILEKFSFFHSVASQISNYKTSNNSMSARIHIYIDSIRASINNFLIGYGPNSFSNYFSIYKSSSGLINPHGLIFELLINYGVVGLIIFLGLILEICLKNMKEFFKNNEKSNLILGIILIILVFASFSPSSFIGYSYQWGIYGIALSAINLKGWYSDEKIRKNII